MRGGRSLQRALQRLTAREKGEDDEAIVGVLDLLQRELSPELRALVLLRYLHGFQAAELAELTGLSPDAVRQRLSRPSGRLLKASNDEEER